VATQAKQWLGTGKLLDVTSPDKCPAQWLVSEWRGGIIARWLYPVCVFRRKAASDSDSFRPLIPTEAGAPIPMKVATR
jgi:hypothetical protein